MDFGGHVKNANDESYFPILAAEARLTIVMTIMTSNLECFGQSCGEIWKRKKKKRFEYFIQVFCNNGCLKAILLQLGTLKNKFLFYI